MLSVEKATEIVKTNLPKGKIIYNILHNDMYIFQVFVEDLFEEELDPFYTVDGLTGEFRDYSFLTDATPEIRKLLEAANPN